jgi:histone-binding protein RBBP4
MSNDAGANGSSEMAAAPNSTDLLDERLIDAEYKIWKKNTPYLYDFVLTHSLEWPSLTCQWLPIARAKGTTSIEHQILIGTHTTENEPNYLMIASCQLPYDDTVVPNPEEDETAEKETVASLRYDEEKKEVGGYGLAGTGVGKIEIKMKIQHEGEVNRYVMDARCL